MFSNTILYNYAYLKVTVYDLMDAFRMVYFLKLIVLIVKKQVEY